MSRNRHNLDCPMRDGGDCCACGLDPLQELAGDADYINCPPLRREWFVESVDSKISSLKLIKNGVWPPRLEAWAVVTMALWLLRTVYGDDVSSAAAISKIAIGKVAEEQLMAQGEATAGIPADEQE